jgi:hypothetical protein
MCGALHEYERITTASGREICVLNNDQPSVVNMCASSPKTFTYVKKRP